jgi:hypothetical protein
MYRFLLTIFCFGIAVSAYAHQPVMDMAPRWDGGYGIQMRHETYGSSELLDGDSEIANPSGLKRHVRKTWIEGVYTFDRSIRITAKLPYIDQSRTKNISGLGVKQTNSGLGDLIIGMPLKKYTNLDDSTGNVSFTPSLRIPTASSSGNFPISDGSWDVGISLSYSKSTPKFYQLYDVFYWVNTEGKRNMREGNELGLDINLGYHPYHDNLTNSGVFLMWDVTARHHEKPNAATLTTASGGERISTGPVFVWYRDNIMFRAEYKLPVYEKKDGIGSSRGQEFQVSIGFTF